MAKAPAFFTDPGKIADAIIKKTGGKIVLGLPLGLGKANHIVNALVDRAAKDKSIDLHIFTALTLEVPALDNDIKKRFLGPASKRLFGDYPGLKYAELLRQGVLPDNIRVNEFFLLAGQWLHVPKVQQNYIPANYTHAVSYLLAAGMNVIAPLVAREGNNYSLSCNPDIAVDLLNARKRGEADFIFAAQVNSELPFMFGDAEIPEGEVDLVLESRETDLELYTAPKRPVTLADQAIGLHAARLVRDGGTLQIGIGSIGDAIAHALILRHKNNGTFKNLVTALDCRHSQGPFQDEPFKKGLYGLSEMFVDGFLQLAEAGILKREVAGAVLEAAFFVDCRRFYKTLRDMPEKDRQKFHMRPVSFTNELFGNEPAKRKARVKACFINNAMMATVFGSVVSDALEDGAVVSGVGGQYNFVAQAFALKDAHSVITLNATRQSKGKTVSNILWSYGHETIPWHLRDIIITEYGVADLRGKSDAEAIAAMISIADSRFQEDLTEKAKAKGKIPKDWKIPDSCKKNTPEHLEEVMAGPRKEGLLPAFPFGTDFSEVEQRLLPALDTLKQKSYSPSGQLGLFLAGLFLGSPGEEVLDCLERMGLKKPANFREYVLGKILTGALKQSKGL